MTTAFNGELLVPVSVGEVIDKIAILRIKSSRISDPVKLSNVHTELSALDELFSSAFPDLSNEAAAAIAALQEVNEILWVIEDDIRLCEANGDFSSVFIELARSVYITNDKRASLKKTLNLMLGSRFVEEKSYASI